MAEMEGFEQLPLPPSSQASSQVLHTSTRFATAPEILYFIITRSHFGQVMAPVVSVVCDGGDALARLARRAPCVASAQYR